MRRIALLLVAAALVGCGGGSDSSAPSTPSVDLNGGASTGVGSGDVGALDAGKCTSAAQALASAAAAVPQAITGVAGNVDQYVDQLKEFADAAPDEIRDDLETIAQGYAEFANVLSDLHLQAGSTQPPSAEDLQKIQAAAAKLSTADFQQALNNVRTWVQEECGG